MLLTWRSMGKKIEVEEGILSLLLFVPQFMEELTVVGAKPTKRRKRRSLGQPHPSQQVGVAGIGAEIIQGGVEFEIIAL